MKIYRYKADPDNYAIELVEDYSDGEWVISSQFNQGRLLASSWHPVEFRADTPKGKVGDFPKPHLSIPVFSEKAWDTLGPLIENDAEALPLIGPNGSYFAINVFRIVDFEAAGGKALAASPKIMSGCRRRWRGCTSSSLPS